VPGALLRWTARRFFGALCWRFEGKTPHEISQAVVIAEPQSSSWDPP
jgi:hypothetical protein